MFNANFDPNRQSTDLSVGLNLKLERLHQQLARLEKQVQELQKSSYIDSLTQLTNRHYFNAYLEQQWQNLANKKARLSLIICEIDCLKIYSQTQGYEAGERCIQQVARAIGECIEIPAGLVSRYEGEKFAVILPRLEAVTALKIAEKIRRKVKKLALPHHPKIDGLPARVVTVSLGVASTIPNFKTFSSNLVLICEQGLTQAKRKGRDRVDFVSMSY